MAKQVMAALGHWRKPKPLVDSRGMVGTVVGNMEVEWLIPVGLNLLGAAETIGYVLREWM